MKTTSIELPTRFMRNYFCIIPNTRIAFVVISKNGCTFLKKAAFYNETGEWLNNADIAHYKIGFTAESKYLIPVSEMVNYESEHGDFIKIAVWRDPVERIISTYKLFCLESKYRVYFQYLGINTDVSFERFMDFLRFEWGKKDPIMQDEHVRRQVDYFNKEQVDYIIPLEKIDTFLEKHMVKFQKEKSNQTNTPFKIESAEYIQEIKAYYLEDYNIPITY